jgi:virginiamycin B lyase
MKRVTVALVVLLAACGTPESTEPSASPIATATGSADERSATPSPEATGPSPTAHPSPTPTEPTFEMATYPLPAGSRPHDVAPAADGGVWYTGQGNGTLGWLDPATGAVREIALGPGSAPHGVVTGPDGDAWVTDSGLNAIVRVDGQTDAVTVHALDGPHANLNTATFGGDGILWFTGQAGVYGWLDPSSGSIEVLAAPRGAGPYGIATAPDGAVFYSSLAGSYLGAVELASGAVTVIDTPTANGGARRVWSDSSGRQWITEWFAGNLARYDPADGAWTTWPLPGDNAMPYAVYVDELDVVWVTDFGANALRRFDPATESWMAFEHESAPANVRQLLGREGEVWGAESAADRLVVVRTID